MKVLLIILAVVLGLGILLTAPELIRLGFTLVLGWLPSAERLFGEMPFTPWDLILFGGGCVGFVLGVHWFLRSIQSWRFRWTFALTGTCAFVLLAIMALIGAAHQVGWILISDQPVFRERWTPMIRDQMDMQRTAKIMGIIADTNAVAARSGSALITDSGLPNSWDGKRPWEKYQVLLLDPTNKGFAVIWPRDERIYRRIGSATVSLDGAVKMHSANYVDEVLGKAQTHGTEAY